MPHLPPTGVWPAPCPLRGAAGGLIEQLSSRSHVFGACDGPSRAPHLPMRGGKVRPVKRPPEPGRHGLIVCLPASCRHGEVKSFRPPQAAPERRGSASSLRLASLVALPVARDACGNKCVLGSRGRADSLLLPRTAASAARRRSSAAASAASPTLRHCTAHFAGLPDVLQCQPQEHAGGWQPPLHVDGVEAAGRGGAGGRLGEAAARGAGDVGGA